jgi:lipoprotein NlpD
VAAAPRPAAGGAAGAAESSRETGREANRDSTREVREREVPTDAAASNDLNWAWPSSGPLLQGFDEQRNKGVDIGGKAGDPVLAAADGRVVYAGSALRGYGNLVILKHNATFLSAYAHNQTLLVKEDQVVKRGQKIAEMGSTDAERVQLHFEIRRDGKPVDPARYLPAR